MVAYKTVVYWQDRIIDQKTIYGKKSITLGQHRCDVLLPAFGNKSPHWQVNDTFFTGLGEDVWERKYLDDKIVVRITFANLKFPKIDNEFLKLSSSEKVGILLSFFITFIWSFYLQLAHKNTIYKNELEEEPWRKAKITFNKPKLEIKSHPNLLKNKTNNDAKNNSINDPKVLVAKNENKRQEKLIKNIKKGEGEKGQGIKNLIGIFRKNQGLDATSELTRISRNAKVSIEQGGSRTKNTQLGSQGSLKTVKIGGAVSGGDRFSKGQHLGGQMQTKGSYKIQMPSSEAEILGNIDRSAIKRVIDENRSAIRFCYEQQLNTKPDLYGKINLQWEITSGGRTKNVKVSESSIQSGQLHSCLVRLFQSLRFPEPPETMDVQVTYPFIFTAK